MLPSQTVQHKVAQGTPLGIVKRSWCIYSSDFIMNARPCSHLTRIAFYMVQVVCLSEPAEPEDEGEEEEEGV